MTVETVDVPARLNEVTILTLEDLAFLLCDEGEPVDVDAPLAAGSVVRFCGPSSGEVRIACTQGVLEDLTTNLIGDASALSAALLEDALGEVVNIICGNLLPHVYGRETVFDLNRPEPFDPAAGITGEHTVTVVVDTGRVEVSFSAH